MKGAKIIGNLRRVLIVNGIFAVVYRVFQQLAPIILQKPPPIGTTMFEQQEAPPERLYHNFIERFAVSFLKNLLSFA
ncbi:hypothetical protein [Bartonella sp. MM73XJBT]|uniref:hypothetical protein n=1 Tax=Bartonella sp. MM73XJBT TaxID=3019095 RepID=UPI002362B6D8|nr:hypothetical protein [Bartonella sp. MM73XJBT]